MCLRLLRSCVAHLRNSITVFLWHVHGFTVVRAIHQISEERSLSAPVVP